MTARFNNLRRVRNVPTAGEVVGVSIGTIIAILLAALAVTLIAPYAAQARDIGQWEGSDPVIREWYRSLKQPDRLEYSCCGESDAYWADDIVVEGDKVFAIITDTRPDEPLGRPHIPPGTRFEIPKHKYKFDAGNPTGHHVIFVNSAGEVLCFVQGSGA